MAVPAVGVFEARQRELSRCVVAELPDFLTVREVAEIFRISRTTAYKEVQRFLDTGGREGIPVLLVGGQKRIPRQKLEPLAGGPIHRPAANAGPCELPAVVDLRDRRPSKPSRSFKRTTSGPSADSPNDIG